jgi:chromate reductase
MTDDGRQRTELAILASVTCYPITMHTPKILVIPGSLHTGSHNSRLAALAAKEFALAEAEVTRISLADYPLPLFDAEMTAEVGPPQNAVQLQRMLRAHHGVFITSPEYNASITPLLKNAIDWLTRARARGEPTYAAFRDRVFAIGAASTGGGGGQRSLLALRQILELGCGALVIPEQVSVANAADAFDEMDNLKDEDLAVSLKALARRLVELARGAMAWEA